MKGEGVSRSGEPSLVQTLLFLGKPPGLPAALLSPKGAPSFPKGKAIY